MNADETRTDLTAQNRAFRLILLAQGSRDPRWQKPFLTLSNRLSSVLGDHCVSMAYLERSTPSLHDIAVQAERDGIEDLLILPLFLALGDHTEQEIPRQVVLIKEHFPGLGVVLLPPIGEHPKVAEAIFSVARASCSPSM